MNKTDITKYADFLLSAALAKCGNVADAQDLAQDTLLAALATMERKPLENPKAWLATVLNRKFYDLLRRKYNKPTVSFDVTTEFPDDRELFDAVEKSDEAESVRRCLAYLTRLYREVMTRYYMRGEKTRDIAAALNVSENTVKSRLDAGRKRIKKELNMENYAKQSYEPETLIMSCSGQIGINAEPFSLVDNDKIAQNLLILAYEKPVTITELAKAIGITAAYVEPIINKLVNGELMKRAGDKVRTDFIIYSPEDRFANVDLEKQIADKIYKDVWAIMDKGFKELRGLNFYKRQTESKQAKLESFFAIRTLLNTTNNVRDEVCGKTPYEEYPNRPNDGKWIAMGNRKPANYDDKQYFAYGKYYISGELQTRHLVDCAGIKKQDIVLCEYDTFLGKCQLGMKDTLKRRMTDMEIAQMLYAVHSGKEEQLPLINAGCFENFDKFIELRYLAKDGDKIVCDVPVITEKERFELYNLSKKYGSVLEEKFHDDWLKLMVNPVKTPSHLKSVPEFQKYMYCSSTISMRIINNALDDGLFPKCANGPSPAILLSVKED